VRPSYSRVTPCVGYTYVRGTTSCSLARWSFHLKALANRQQKMSLNWSGWMMKGELPTPTFELMPSPPDQFAIALRWRVEDEEFGVSQHVATTHIKGFPLLKMEQLEAIEKVIQSYVEWANDG